MQYWPLYFSFQSVLFLSRKFIDMWKRFFFNSTEFSYFQFHDDQIRIWAPTAFRRLRNIAVCMKINRGDTRHTSRDGTSCSPVFWSSAIEFVERTNSRWIQVNKTKRVTDPVDCFEGETLLTLDRLLNGRRCAPFTSLPLTHLVPCMAIRATIRIRSGGQLCRWISAGCSWQPSTLRRLDFRDHLAQHRYQAAKSGPSML